MRPSSNGSTLPQTALNKPESDTRYCEQATGVGQTRAASQATGAHRAAQVKRGSTPMTLPDQLPGRPGT